MLPDKKRSRERDRKFQLLFAAHPQPMWVLDPEARKILEANRAAAVLYGHSVRQFRGMSLDDIELNGQPRHSLGDGWRHCTRDGRVLDIEMLRHTITYQGRSAELVTLLDVTERVQLEGRLRQAQKMQAVGLLAGGVAHDFNNLLTIIAGYGQMIANSLDPGDTNHYAAEQILKAGERAAGLTQQLLAFSRRQAPQFQVLDLNKLVRGLSSMLRRLIGEDIDLRLTLQPDVAMVKADTGQLEQVLMNLVVNARDAMPQGGLLTIETGNARLNAEQSSALRRPLKPGAYTTISVKDSGSGMDAATQILLFEPFFTTKGMGQGTGLGLSTVLSIVKQSGGSVEVTSEAGAGTNVKVYLPSVETAAVEASVKRRTLLRGTETVLVVEDEEMVRRLVKDTLDRAGYKVLDAAEPEEAHRIVGSYRGNIDLLITDVVMPKVNGKELAEMLTAERPGLKVLYMSGYTDRAVENTGVLAREVAFLQKPFTPSVLTEKVREVLENGLIRHAAE
jgi:two-component system cell cycle sensor histidine kinase/response regulator CckA